MKRQLPRVVTAMLMAAAALPAYANDWGQVATVSSTLGINDGRLCVGEASRGDLGCPSYAPSLTTEGHVSVTGNLSAVKFIGDGSELTGLTTTGDRIVSGTSSVIVSESGHISFTTAGTERMVINASGNVGIGTASPGNTLEVYRATSGVGAIADFTAGLTGNGQAAGIRLGDFTNTKSGIYHIRTGANSIGDMIFAVDSVTDAADVAITDEKVRITSSGNVGIGTAVPASQLTVGGGSNGSVAICSKAGCLTGYAGTDQPTLKSTGSNLYFDVNGYFSGYLSANEILYKRFVDFDNSSYYLDPGNIATSLLVAGKVGIGTTSPGKTLDVSGTAQIVSRTIIGGSGTPSGTLHVSGSLMVAGNDSIACTAVTSGLMRRDPTTGRMQVCR